MSNPDPTAATASPLAIKDSLLSPQAMGGLRGGRGYDAERDYILARLHNWLAEPGFRAVQIEGFSEIELLFGGESSRRLAYIQVKDHAVGLDEGRKVLVDEFVARDQSISGPKYQTYTLACNDLVGQFQSLRNAIERYQKASFYTPAEKETTLQEIDSLLQNYKISCTAQFLVDKVYFDLDGDWLKSEQLRRSLFHLHFQDLPGYTFDSKGIDALYAQLLTLIELNRGETISHEDIEGTIRRCELPSIAVPSSIRPDDIVSYAETLQSWLVSYQEEAIGWRAIYTPLQARKLPVRVENVWGTAKSHGAVPEDVLETTRKHRKLILIGDPGSGKTTTALKVAYDLAEHLKTNPSASIPVIAFLRELSPATDIKTLIGESLIRHGLLLDPKMIDQLIGSPDRLYLIFEGMNEIGRAARQSDQHKSLPGLVHSARAGILVTTRREGYDPDLLPGLPSFEILPLGVDDIGAFLEAHFADIAGPLLTDLQSASRENRHGADILLHFASNPLLLIMLACVYRKTLALPANLGELLERFTTYIIDHEALKGSELLPETRQAILESLAARMLNNGRLMSIDRPSMTAAAIQSLADLKQSHQILADVTTDTVMNEIDRRVFRFLRSGPDKQVIEWEHQLFQEYYGASWLRRNLLTSDALDQRKEILRGTLAPEWVESLRMLVGILQEDVATEIVQILLELDPFLGALAFSGANVKVQENTRQDVLASVAPKIEGREPSQRLEAARIIGRLGKLALSLLLSALGDEDGGVRRAVAQQLDTIAPGSLDELELADRRDIRRRLVDNPHYLDHIESHEDALVERWMIWLMSEMLRFQSLPELMQPQARQAVEAALRSRDVATKLSAARSMARSGSDEAAAALAELMLTERGEFGQSARLAFTMLSADRQINVLLILAMAHSEVEVRDRAQKSLGDYGETAAAATLKALDRSLETKEIESAVCLIAALGFIGVEPAYERLVRHANLATPQLCGPAAEALGHTGNPKAVEPLIAILRHQELPQKYQDIWESAARGLISLGETALPAVSEFAQHELKRTEIIEPVLNVLTAAGVSGVPSLMMLLGHERAEIRAGAVLRLGWLRVREAVDAINTILTDPSENVRAAALEAQYAVQRGEILSLVQPGLEDLSETVRATAAKILMLESRQASALRALSEHLDDPVIAPYAWQALRTAGISSVPFLIECLANPASRENASRVLVELGTLSIGPLTAILTNVQDNRRLEVLWILAKIIPDEAATLAQPLLNDPSPDMRSTALQIVVSLGALDWETNVVEKMRDPSASVRRIAVQMAQESNSRYVGQALMACLADESEEVRDAAETALCESEATRWVVDEIVGMAARHKLAVAREAARNVLKQLDTAALPALTNVFASSKNDKAVRLVSNTLNALGYPAYETLVPLLDSSDEQIRQRTISVLKHNPMLAVSALLSRLKSGQDLSPGSIRFLLSCQSLAIKPLIAKLRELSESNHAGRAIVRNVIASLCRHDKTVDLLDWLMKTPEISVRRDLFDVLREVGQIDIARLAEISRKGPLPDRNCALEALGWSGAAEALIVAREVLNSKKKGLQSRRTACQVLGAAKSNVCMPELIAVLGDPDEEIRCLAVWGLGQLREVSVIEPLGVVAKDPSASVRMELARSLGVVGKADAYDLLKGLAQDEDPDVTCVAADVLGEFPHPQATYLLLEMAFSNVRPLKVRLAAGMALADKDVSIVEALLPNYCGNLNLATSENFDVLKRLGSSATMALISTLKDPSYSTARLALETLGLIGDSRALSATIELAQDYLQARAPYEVMIEISNTLGAIGNADAVPILDELQRENYHWKEGQRIVEAVARAKEHIEQRLG